MNKTEFRKSYTETLNTGFTRKVQSLVEKFNREQAQVNRGFLLSEMPFNGELKRLYLCDELNEKVPATIEITTATGKKLEVSLKTPNGMYAFSSESGVETFFNCLAAETEGCTDEEIFKSASCLHWDIVRQYMGDERYKAAGGK